MAQGDQPESQGAATDRGLSPAGPVPRTVRLDGLVLLDTAATEPVAIETILFADNGIGACGD